MRRKRHNVVKWYCEVWITWFWILESCPVDYAQSFLKRNDIHYVDLNYEGKTIFKLDGEGPIVIWTRPLKTEADRYSILAHECVHAAHVCLSRKGVKSDFDNDEPVTYLVQQLIKQALEHS